MNNLPIIEELTCFKNKKYTKFFMPGHLQLEYKNDYTKKQKEVFFTIKKFEKNIFSFDVTEVNNFDNLANPSGIIKKSQSIIANDFLSKKAYFLVNGSTVGILAGISALVSQNDKIIIQKNSHKSVYNACRLNNLDIVYIKSQKNEDFDTYQNIDLNELEKTLSQNKQAKLVLITSPDYYGCNQDIKKISKLVHKYNMYLVVDFAHASHYNYGQYFSKNAINLGADLCITSFHKTLPCINQTAILLVSYAISDEICDMIQEKINIFQTTSPSYILLANIELTNSIMKKYGKVLYKKLKENVDDFKKNLNSLNFKFKEFYLDKFSNFDFIFNLDTFCSEFSKTDNIYFEKLKSINKKYYEFIKWEEISLDIKILENDDFSRIVIGSKDINYIYEKLKENHKILVEMVNTKSMVLISNIFHTKSDFGKLYKALKQIYAQYIYDRLINKSISNTYKKEIKSNKKQELLNYLKKNYKKRSKKNIYSYPPGLPIISVGDIIEKSHIEYILEVIKNENIDLIF